MDEYNGYTSWIADNCPDTFSEFIFLFPSCSCSVTICHWLTVLKHKMLSQIPIKTAGLVLYMSCTCANLHHAHGTGRGQLAYYSNTRLSAFHSHCCQLGCHHSVTWGVFYNMQKTSYCIDFDYLNLPFFVLTGHLIPSRHYHHLVYFWS